MSNDIDFDYDCLDGNAIQGLVRRIIDWTGETETIHVASDPARGIKEGDATLVQRTVHMIDGDTREVPGSFYNRVAWVLRLLGDNNTVYKIHYRGDKAGHYFQTVFPNHFACADLVDYGKLDTAKEYVKYLRFVFDGVVPGHMTFLYIGNVPVDLEPFAALCNEGTCFDLALVGPDTFGTLDKPVDVIRYSSAPEWLNKLRLDLMNHTMSVFLNREVFNPHISGFQESDCPKTVRVIGVESNDGMHRWMFKM
jgi:hypothetical protein